MEILMQDWFSGSLGSALVRLLNMSAAAAVLICAVVLLRALLRRAPKWTRGILWAIVAVQLVCPVSLRSPLSVYSLLPRSNEVKSDQVEVFRTGGGSEKPLLILDTPQIAGYDRPVQEGAVNVPDAPLQPNPSVYLPAAGAVWLSGVAVMLLYALWSWLTLRRRVHASVPLEGRAMLCDAVDTPFILGFFRPRVYLPSGLSDAQRDAVIAHETAHLRRRDHWWKPLGWLLLSVHWFNPLVWLAYALLCRDIELACDERAVRDMDSAARADYSQALLDCAAPRALLRVCPLAFGEVGIKARIKAVLNYKKPAFWIIVAAVAVCAVVAICFLTRPGPIEAPAPTNHSAVEPTAWPTLAPFMPMYDGIDPENARIYLLDEEYYPDSRDPFSRDPFRSFSITLDMEKELFQYYETPISSYIGLGSFELDGDILTIRDNRVNRFRLANDGEKLVWIAEGSDNFTFIKLTDGATFSLNHSPAVTASPALEAPRQLTLDDVRALAVKGDALTWEDFDPYFFEEAGSGLYIRRYPIDEIYDLLIGASDPKTEPLYFYLRDSERDMMIDIRTEDVNAFLEREAQAEPYLTVSSGGQSAAAYPLFLNSLTWVPEHHSWLAADGIPTERGILEHYDEISTLTLADDVSFTFGGGAESLRRLRIYDAQPALLREAPEDVSALYDLTPGSYYCCVDVSLSGRYIEEKNACESSAYRCVFRLVVPE